LQNTVPECLSRFFPDGKILPFNIPEFLAGAVKVRCVPGAPNDVDLDINIEALKCAIFKRGLWLLDQHKYEEGLEAFEALLELNPTGSLILYNLACAEALLGHSERALDYLSRSIDCGYSNLAHMEVDSDLDSIRSLDSYAKLAESLRAKKQCQHKPSQQPLNPPIKVGEENLFVNEEENHLSNEEVPKQPESCEHVNVNEEEKSEPKPESVPAALVVPVVEIVAPKPIEEQKPRESEEEIKFRVELQLLSDMGFVDRPKNLALLIAENGDLANVVHHLFAN